MVCLSRVAGIWCVAFKRIIWSDIAGKTETLALNQHKFSHQCCESEHQSYIFCTRSEFFLFFGVASEWLVRRCVLLFVSFWVLFDDHGVYCSVEGQSLGGSGSAASSISPSQHTHTHSRSVRGMMIAEILFSTDSWKPRVSWLFIYNNRFSRAQKIRVVANVFFPRHLSTVHPVWTTRHLGFITT